MHPPAHPTRLRHAALAALLVAGTAASAQTPGKLIRQTPERPVCDQTACALKVDVLSTDMTALLPPNLATPGVRVSRSFKACVASFSYDTAELVFRANDTATKTVTWTLSPVDPADGYEYYFFPPAGIVILGAAGQVDLDATTATTVTARAKFRAGTWEYRHAPVVLRRPTGGGAAEFCSTLDPVIRTVGN